MAKKVHMPVHSEYRKYQRQHPSLTGVSEIVDILRRGNVRGVYLDTVVNDLETHAREYMTDLIKAFRNEKNRWVRRLLLSVIAEAGVATATPLLAENLHNDDEALRSRAIVGLMNVGTPEAREALREARSYTFASPEETAAFRHDLEELID
jgi:HEAT repeat protein